MAQTPRTAQPDDASLHPPILRPTPPTNFGMGDISSTAQCGSRSFSRTFRYAEASKLLADLQSGVTAGYLFFQSIKTSIGKHRGSIISISKGLATTTGLVMTCIALWSAIGAMEDSRRAVRIAEWTAKKDFLEYCEEAERRSDGCDLVRATSLGPPPIAWIRLRARSFRQGVKQSPNTFPGSIIIFFGFPLVLGLWLMFRTKLRRSVQRRLRYSMGSGQQQPPGFLSTDRVPPVVASHANSTGVDFRQSSTGPQRITTRRIVFGTGVDMSFDFTVPSTTQAQDPTGLSTALENPPQEVRSRRRNFQQTAPHIATAPSTIHLPAAELEGTPIQRIYKCSRCISRPDLSKEEQSKFHIVYLAVLCKACRVGIHKVVP